MTYKTTPERRANLVKLARFLYTEPIEASQFRMSCYNTHECSAVAIAPGCGTAGCAVGWAVNAGIVPEPDEDHYEFSCRTLIEGDDIADDIEEDNAPEWLWCFDSGWGIWGGDNTPQGAAKRILWLLVNGLPYNWKCQANGTDLLCYRDWQPTEADWQQAAVDA
jgi:hypothetical protein